MFALTLTAVALASVACTTALVSWRPLKYCPTLATRSLGTGQRFSTLRWGCSRELRWAVVWGRGTDHCVHEEFTGMPRTSLMSCTCLQTDPSERTNVAAANPDVVQELTQRLFVRSCVVQGGSIQLACGLSNTHSLPAIGSS